MHFWIILLCLAILAIAGSTAIVFIANGMPRDGE